MKKISLALLWLILVLSGSYPTGAESPLGPPRQVIRQADFDYPFLNRIDRITPPYPANSRYQIGDLPLVKGKYTIYKYLIEYSGRTAEKGRAKFHDLLLIKVNAAGQVADAYKYTLEWADTPSLALYRLGRKGMQFKPDLKLTDLGLVKGGPERKMIKTVEIVVANEDGKPIKRQKIGQCVFYADYSFKISSEPEVAAKLTAAIKRARQKEGLLLRTEEKVGDKLVMSGEYLKPGDQNYIHALVIESARLLNEESPSRYFSLE